MTSLVRYLKDAMPAPLKNVAIEAYMRLFRHHEYRALHDYAYTDEYLKCVHILETINYAKVAAVPHVYFEFGCHSARTFSAAVRAARFLELSDAQFFAFDSFQGLPKVDSAEDGTFASGSFATPVAEFIRLVKAKSGLRLARENIIEGFFEKSLTPQLQRRLPKVGVVHIDVDLYSSTVAVLEFVKPLLVVGTVLIFDDWYCFPPGTNKGEARALDEFCKAHPTFEVEEWKAYSTFGRSFFVKATPC